jgi:type IV pilus assembly protein PilW
MAMKNQHRRRWAAGRVTAHAQRGLTLIELMVAMTIGLFIVLGVGLFTVTASRQFKTTDANSAADVNTQVALSLIDNAGRSAGAGLYNNGLPVCRTLNAWRNGVTSSNGAVFMPARITDGGSAGASDTIVFTAGRAQGALSSMPVVAAMADANASVVVSSGGVINNGDYALVGVPVDTTASPAPPTPPPCTLMQLTAAPVPQSTAAACGGNASSCQTLARAGGSTGANPSSASTAFTTPATYGFAASGVVSGPAVVTRLGSEFRQTAFRVMCGSLVTYNAFTDTPACASATSFSGGANAVVSDVVLVHAQYGVIAVGANDDVVTSWVSASGVWANPSASDAARVKAIRVVLVTRAKEPDLAQVSTACTNGAGIANTGPCGFDDAEAPAIDVSGLTVATGRTWQNYRYRTHTAVIPLRSVLWSM